MAQQHLAILYLTGDLTLDTVHQIVTDEQAAVDHALTALEGGFLDRIALILSVNPAILQTAGTGYLLLALTLLANGDKDQAVATAELAARNASPIQRRAHLIRLHTLAESAITPPIDSAALRRLIAAFETTPHEAGAGLGTSDSDS